MKTASLLLALFVGFTSLTAMANSQDDDRKMCEMYKERLKKYQREGVMGFSLISGRPERMPREQAEQVIRDTEDNIKLFCRTVGVVR